jgi:hypothetical protein
VILSDADYIGVMGRCACGFDVAKYTANAGLVAVRFAAKGEDYWVACTNAECEHHEGEPLRQDSLIEWCCEVTE